MKINSKIGISLVVLVITIIVIIILAGGVILSLVNNNPINSANKAVYLNDLKSFQTELELYKLNEFSSSKGGYDPTLLQADEASVTYDGVVDTSITMQDLIPSLNKYPGQFQVIDGNLVFVGLDSNKQTWTREVGIEVVVIGEPKITILSPTKTLVAPSEEIVYTVKFSSNAPLTTIDLIGKIELLDNINTRIPVQPVIDIGTVSGTSEDAIRQVDITIKTDILVNGSYKLRINPGVVTNENNISNSLDAISLIGFTIDDIAPDNPVMSATPTGWTNGDVTVSITYSEDTIVKEYSFDSKIWQTYTAPVVVTENNVTVYSRGIDIVGNESGLATLTVANIDKTLPIINIASGEITTSSVTITTSASDVGSGINTSSYQYAKDDGLTWTEKTSSTSYTFTGLTTGIYNFKVKVEDNVVNVAISDTLQLSTQAVGAITLIANPTTWTNGNVNVTINYPTEIVTKQYSTDGTTWNDYLTPVTVSSNNTTVYAKGLDVAGNQTLQASLTVANIDKTVPVISATNGGSTTSSVTVTAIVSDSGGSLINAASYQYSKDNGATWTSSTSATSNTFNLLSTGTYQCKVKVLDNAGNVTISNTIDISTQGIGTITLGSSPTGWTNGNVTVTINYPTQIVTKQYSTNGTTWNTYSSPIIVTTNNTTVYAKGLDVAGNQTLQASLTVANIDKVAPVTSFTDELVINVNTIMDSTFLKNNTTITDNVSAINQISINNIEVRNSANAIVGNTLSGYDIYTVKYSVVDAVGNSSNITRTIVTKPTTSINLTNILPDPSYELGTSYWYNFGGESIRVTERAYSGSYSYRVYSNSAQNWPRYNYSSYNIQGKSIYTRVYAYKQLSSLAPGLTFATSATTNEWPVQTKEYMNYSKAIPINQWTIISLVIPSAEYQYFNIMTPQTNHLATGYIWFDGLMVIDLTASFGSNVPTSPWVDRMIPYFSGNSTFSW